MLRENIEAQCRRISPDAYSEKSVCAFAPRRGIVGFIDTSAARDGSRGIAFLGDRMLVNTDGAGTRDVEYKKIIDLHIIDSFEDAFADELSVAAKGMGELRISDYSLDKSELKALLDELCREQKQVGRRVESYARQVARKLAENTEKAQNLDAQRLENAARELYKSSVIEEQPVIEEISGEPVIYEEAAMPVIVETTVEIPEERSPLPEDYEPAVIPEGEIDWISGKGTVRASDKTDIQADEPPQKDIRPKLPKVLNGFIDRTPVMATAKKSEKETEKTAETPEQTMPEESEDMTMLSESEMRERIENMTSGEMMEFLAETLNEINDTEEVPPEKEPLPPENTQENVPEMPPTRWKKLTTEPIWGDIYIKASSSLRQLCESGKLTMEQMEDELRDRLLIAAEAFEKLTGSDSHVPKVMIPKITELKLAADNFDSYFSYGEDIAIRAMFFMLYQMLTYADRIAESPETKASLNDFFRRFGSAGITLSMLDMRV